MGIVWQSVNSSYLRDLTERLSAAEFRRLYECEWPEEASLSSRHPADSGTLRGTIATMREAQPARPPLVPRW